MTAMDKQIRETYLACGRALVEGSAGLDLIDERGIDISLPVFSVGQVAQMADVHPQTLRQYDRLGLVVPRRTGGGARRYSLRDVDRLCQAQHLSQDESINLAGVTRILALAEENRQLRRQIRRLNQPDGSNVFSADSDGEVVEMERSGRARLWRHQAQVKVRGLLPPADEGYRDEGDYGDDDYREDGDRPLGESKSLVIWGLL
ncbi:putative MerR family transcriptional regulator [Bifidobacterium actinocoloniiforme DSM 22766]|uniref:Putative MerR family transcriptional regulator n=1 Tax=Bifidobacterium actinocoloniiforme DSM 22766 TaxID=1437605 RepID=A0A086YYC0_9BIFI|nr:MerR family transcriptional regulator [Bifidobacterium actinocoloniiforme]AKV55835.1 hypothetical protein AB656_06325 [Bifidobacterium actinocoloniiforme DSM 22766]KFI39270.1 putative MerR family transcriptional regulator [Bifidobacterium actinocoloniiforme DSM 22766]